MDSDLHVIEGAAVFDEYLDERWRDLGPTYQGWGPTGFPWWSVKTSTGTRSIPPWASAPSVASAQAALHGRNNDIYADAKACGYDAASTLVAMDIEGIDVAVMFRTFASMVLSLDDLEAAHAGAISRAFNDWLHDYCAADPARLKSSAIVSLHDPELAAAEARRSVERGAVAVALLEGNLGWLPWWLDRLDDQWHKYGRGEAVALDALPSEYFRRQCWIGADIDESLLPLVAERVGEDRIVISTDYPHQDGPFPHAIEELMERKDVSPDLLRKLLWDNCATLYGLA